MSNTQSKKILLPAIAYLKRFVSLEQLQAIAVGLKGEERPFFANRLLELHQMILNMPTTKQTDGQGDEAIIFLHYFKGNADWWITEKDILPDQQQAFGLADLGMGFPELGYISLTELIEAGVELDLHYEPRTLAQQKAENADHGPVAKPKSIDNDASEEFVDYIAS